MSLRVPVPAGIERMMKQGSQRYTGIEDGVYRNIEACIELSKYIMSTFGPNGRSKMVINYLEKLFVTSDCSTIIKELDVQHPACKLIVMAVQHQERECGDGTSQVLLLCVSLLENAMKLLRSGLALKDIISDYKKAMEDCLGRLGGMSVESVLDMRNKECVKRGIKSVISSKQCGLESFLSDLVADACISILSERNEISVDNVRILGILGGNIVDSYGMKGLILRNKPESVITDVTDGRIVVYSCGLDISHTETKGTVLLNTGDELLNYSNNEENIIKNMIKAIVDAGCNVIVSIGKIGDIHKHWANYYGILLIRLTSKFDLKRLCQATGATSLPSIVVPTKQSIGYSPSVTFQHIGSTPVVVFQHNTPSVATIVLRGSSDHMINDIEKAVDDGINAFKILCRDNRLIPGGGATEIQLSNGLLELSNGCPGALEQAAFALLGVVKLMTDCPGNSGVIVKGDTVTIGDVVEAGVLDLLYTKEWVIRNAFSTAITILNIDEVIVSKPAGGPRPRETGTNAVRDEDD